MKNYINILLNHSHPFWFLVGRLLVKTGLCRLLTISQKGYRLRFYPSNLSEQLWVDKGRREPELLLMRAVLRRGDTVVDVGANIGDTALTAAYEVSATGHVWAIEPHPRTYSFLVGNIELNKFGNITSINRAVASEPGRLSFSDERRDDMNRVDQHGIDVVAQTLDKIIEYDGPVTLLKVDVEGYELPVLQGARSLLSRTQFVLIEVAEKHFEHFGYDLHAVLQILDESGFELLRPVGPGVATKIDVDFRTSQVENLVAVRDRSNFVRRSGWIVN